MYMWVKTPLELLKYLSTASKSCSSVFFEPDLSIEMVTRLAWVLKTSQMAQGSSWNACLLSSEGIYRYVLGVFGVGNHAYGLTELEEEPLKA